MSLKDGLKKMSKSEASDMSRINLSDTEDQIINKIKKAKTDPLPMPTEIKDLDKRPEARNLLAQAESLEEQAKSMRENAYSMDESLRPKRGRPVGSTKK